MQHVVGVYHTGARICATMKGAMIPLCVHGGGNTARPKAVTCNASHNVVLPVELDEFNNSFVLKFSCTRAPLKG